MLQLVAIKSIVLVVLFVLTFILGVIPIKVVRFARKRDSHRNLRNFATEDTHVARPVYKRVISFLSCYAAGVFLATCFLDLLPDVRKKLVNVLDVMKIYTGFPLAEFIMSMGLFGILITEQIVLAAKETHSRKSDDRAPLLSNSEDWNKSTESTYSDPALSGISDRPHRHHDVISHGESDSEHLITNIDPSAQAHEEHHTHNADLEEQPHSPIRAVLLLIALSLHSIFEGLTVGLEEKTQDVLEIFAALVLHKSILSFSLGMNLVQTKLSSKVMIRSILCFSVTAPLGIGLGIGIIKLWDSTTSSLVQGLLQGLACGTFLYITFFEVLSHEFSSHYDRVLKLLFLLLGYSTVTGILFMSDSVQKPFCTVVNHANGTSHD